MESVGLNIFQRIAMGFQGGGLFMYPIAILFIVTLAISIERFHALFMKYYIDAASFMTSVLENVAGGKIDQAMKICQKHKNAAVSRVALAGLNAAEDGEEALLNAIDVANLHVVPELQKRTNYLQMIANVATLFGLLGTIVGIIAAFAGLAAVDPVSRQEALSKGISEALNATAFGLLVAIPAMIIHSILTNRTLKMVEEIDLFSAKLIPMLTRNFGRPSLKAARGARE